MRGSGLTRTDHCGWRVGRTAEKVLVMAHDPNAAPDQQPAARRLIRARTAVVELFQPWRQAVAQVASGDAAGALSQLSAHHDLWTAHCAMVGFVIDVLGYGDEQGARLVETDQVNDWTDDERFRQYVDAVEPGLEAGIHNIELDFARPVLRAAQGASIRTDHCLRRCPEHDIKCLNDCLRRGGGSGQGTYGLFPGGPPGMAIPPPAVTRLLRRRMTK